MIEIKNVSQSYVDGVKVIDNMNFMKQIKEFKAKLK